VDRAGIHLSRRALRAQLDVLIDGIRVFSWQPGSAGPPRERDLLPWPDVLLPYVRGAARVTVVTRGGRLLLDEECVFDARSASDDGRMRVVDRSGQPLVVDKNGRLQRAFATSASPDTAVLLDHVEATLATLAAVGVDAFVTAGALLGAVRDGHLIGHDTDADIAYASRAVTPAGVALESYRLERVLRRGGVPSRRFSAAEFKLLLPGPSGTTTGIDVRAAFVLGDTLYVAPNVGAPRADET